VAYDDSTWETGEAGFGYGDDDDQTVLDDMQGSYTTVYIRKRFTVGDPAQVGALTLKVLIDDGFVAYVNGNEIARHNAGSYGEVRYFTSTADGAVEPTTQTFDVTANPTTLLRTGTNVLAIIGLNSARTARTSRSMPSSPAPAAPAVTGGAMSF